MMGTPTHEQKQLEKELRKRRRNRYMILSTWGTTLAAFVGFFTIWNHLASASTHSAAQGTTAASSTAFSSGTTHHRHDDAGGDNGGFSDDRSFSQSGQTGSGSGTTSSQSGSVNISPSQTPGFTSRAS
ncbi:hypothetical protein [Alicyclobacillus sp. SO9]|uniref:hypothetical protein n=1 Tax=Alicyclobacillus sp. SO9 TaxID=2665646 RepID=UPI0018E841B6|nr:hypothetical protein [Alicyclobacillus sp. SO9]QQE77815.1 hypothetical protein GI364_18105 [Alicyclobacillus sp. SO9]